MHMVMVGMLVISIVSIILFDFGPIEPAGSASLRIEPRTRCTWLTHLSRASYQQKEQAFVLHYFTHRLDGSRLSVSRLLYH